MNQSNIQWTNYTHNFWSGCKKVSAGCKYCYMYRIKEDRNLDASNVLRATDSYFYSPLRMQEPKMIFTCSMSDFFIEDADGWRTDAWRVIRETPKHIWQILTKRPERIQQCLPKDWGNGYSNVWLGVTVEDQSSFGRIQTLSKIPSKLRFVSAEPLLERINFLQLDKNGIRTIDNIQWVIIGGESGNDTGKYKYRPTEALWINEAVCDLKVFTKTKVFVKQMGTFLGRTLGMKGNHGDDYSKFPKYMRIREMPEI